MLLDSGAMELASGDGEFLVGEYLLERFVFSDKRSFPFWVSDGCLHFGEAFVEGGVFLDLYLLVFASCVSLVVQFASQFVLVLAMPCESFFKVFTLFSGGGVQ